MSAAASDVISQTAGGDVVVAHGGPRTLLTAALLATLSTPALPAAAATSSTSVAGSAANSVVSSVDDTTLSGTTGRFSYAGPWSTSSGAGDYAGSDHYASTAGASTTLTFTGVQVQLYGAVAPWHGRGSVSLDGGPAQQVDFYSATRQDQALVFRSQLLAPGVHTLVLTATGSRMAASSGTVITMDRADVTTSAPPPASPVSSIDDAAPAAVTYAGAWSMSTSPSAFAGADHYTSAAGATMTLQFSGSGVSLYSALAPWHGRATVSIDGLASGTVDEYAAARQDQSLVYSSAPLADGAHTLVETVTGTGSRASSGTVIAFDRADVTTPVAGSPGAAAPPATGAPPPSSVPIGFLARCGTGLCLDGKPYRFAGFNAYSMATQWSTNIGCGSQVDDLDGYFNSLRPASVTRVAAEQQQAIDPVTHLLSFAALDRLVTAAAGHGQKLSLTLGNEWAGCDDGAQKDQAWFAGGYRQVRNSTGFYPLSYWDYVRAVVSRYKNSPAIGMWELVNEPKDGTCSTGFVGDGCSGTYICPTSAAQTLRTFFDTVGGEVKRLDPNHLIASGVVGDQWQCGTIGVDYPIAQASPALDLLTYHDYGADGTALPGDSVNGLAARISQAAAIGKPLFVEEAGIEATAGPASCDSLPQRAVQFRAKMDALFAGGGVGYLIWNWMPSAAAGCDHTVTTGDPLLELVRSYPL